MDQCLCAIEWCYGTPEVYTSLTSTTRTDGRRVNPARRSPGMTIPNRDAVLCDLIVHTHMDVGDQITPGIVRHEEEETMPIWKLEPQNPDSPHWQASTYEGTVIVRAASEQDARHVVMQAFTKGSPQVEDTLLNPWGQEPLVFCTRVHDSGYDEDGQDEVLEPTD